MLNSTLAVFGSLTIDDHVFPDGSTRWGAPGGAAAYAALGAALWTDHVSLIAPIGADFPVSVLSEQVDLSHCRPIPHSMRNWGLHEEDGQRHFISRSRCRRWHEFCPSVSDVASGGQLIAHLAAMPSDLALSLAKELRRNGARLISLDMDDHDLLGDTGCDLIQELIRSVDLFLPSRYDAQRLTGRKDPVSSLGHLRTIAPDISLIAIKCGSDGVVAHISGTSTWIHVPAYPVTVIDETGAGDAFCGGVLAGFMHHDDPILSLVCGSISASYCVSNSGFNGLINVSDDAIKQRINYHRATVRLEVLRQA